MKTICRIIWHHDAAIRTCYDRPMSTEQRPPSPDEILQLKAELKERWDRLPVEHQSVVVLNLLRELFDGEYQVWMVVALKVLFPQLSHDSDA